MYAHQVIEDIVKYNPLFMVSRKCKENILASISAIQQSIQFHAGNVIDIDKAVRKEDSVFMGELSMYAKMPFKTMWVDFSMSTGNQLGILAEKQGNGIIGFGFFLKPKHESFFMVPITAQVSINIHLRDIPGNPMKMMDAGNIAFYSISKLKDALDKNLLYDELDTYLALFEKVLILLNCKNITTEDHKPDVALNKSRRKKGKQELFTYKTLKLILPSNKKGSDSSGQPTGEHNRVHLCRGHFKKYTEEHPLFGKYTGLYWWQPHVRGQNKDGIVMKDYNVTTK